MLLSDSEGDGDENDDEPDGGISNDIRCVHDKVSVIIMLAHEMY